MKRNRRLISQADIHDHEEHYRGKVGKGRGYGSSCHIQMEAEDQHRIQHHIQDTAEHHTGTGWPGVAFASQQMPHSQTQHGRHAAQHHYPVKITLCISIGIRTCPQKIQEGFPEEKGQKGKQQSNCSSSPYAESRYIFNIFVIISSQQSGDQTASSQPKKVSQSRKQVKPGDTRDTAATI